MKALRGILLLLFASCRLLEGSSGSAQHSLNISVPPVCALSVWDYSPFQYDIYPVFPGGPTYSAVQDGNSTFSISNNIDSNRVILCRLSGELPNGISITAKLKAPPGAVSQQIGMTTSDQIVLSSIGMGAFANYQIIYFVYGDYAAMKAQPRFSARAVYTLISGS